MKGKPYEKGMDVHKNIKLIGRKYDGFRGVVKIKNGEYTMDSYENMDNWNHLFHIEEDIRTFSMYLPEDFILDGEIYKHGWSRAKIQSVITTRKRKHRKLTKLKYHIFDLLWKNNKPSEKRYQMLLQCYQNCIDDDNELDSIEIMQNYVVCTEDDMVFFKDIVSEEYEGAFVRFTSRKYRKPFRCTFETSTSPSILPILMFVC